MSNRTRSLVVAIFLNFGIVAIVPGQVPSVWREKLFPLISTKEDVERILGKPDKWNKEYKTDEGRFRATYSKGNCENGDRRAMWNVERGTLILLLVLLNDLDPISPESYEPELNTFRREHAKATYGFQYTSPDESVVIFTIPFPDVGERVTAVELVPSKDQQNLKCRPSSEQ